MKNLKDTVTTICGLLIAVTGSVQVIIAMGVVLPQTVVSGSIIVGVVSMSVLGYFTGKNPDGSKKTPEQIAAQLKQNDDEKASN